MKTKTTLAALMLLLALAVSFTAKAQVTIGSGEEPDPDALLDLKSGVGSDDDASNKGLLLPRVALSSTTSFAPMDKHVQGMFVYNTATVGDVTPGIYYNDGAKWVRTVSPDMEPWRVQGTLNTATTNGQDIYQMGQISVGSTTDVDNGGIRIVSTPTNGINNDLALDNYKTDIPTLVFRNYGEGPEGNTDNIVNGRTVFSLSSFGQVGGGMFYLSGLTGMYKGDGTTPASNLRFITSGNSRMVVDETGNVGIGGGGDFTPSAKLDINAGNVPGTGFKMTDGSQGAGKVLTSDANGVGTWAAMLPNFQTAEVNFAYGTRVFASGTNSTAQVLANNVGADGSASLTSSNIPDFTVNTTNGYISVPKGKYFVYFYGDISNAEYAYAILRNADNNSNLLRTIASECFDNFTMLTLTSDIQLYLAVGGITNNPSPTFYLTASQYAAGLLSSFKLTFLKYGE